MIEASLNQLRFGLRINNAQHRSQRQRGVHGVEAVRVEGEIEMRTIVLALVELVQYYCRDGTVGSDT